jgi:hypothetical protein
VLLPPSLPCLQAYTDEQTNTDEENRGSWILPMDSPCTISLVIFRTVRRCFASTHASPCTRDMMQSMDEVRSCQIVGICQGRSTVDPGLCLRLFRESIRHRHLHLYQTYTSIPSLLSLSLIARQAQYEGGEQNRSECRCKVYGPARQTDTHTNATPLDC